jgi:hypothetical protein
MTLSGLGGVQEFGCATKPRTVAPLQRACSRRGVERMPVVAWRIDGGYTRSPPRRCGVAQWTGRRPVPRASELVRRLAALAGAHEVAPLARSAPTFVARSNFQMEV